VLRILGNEKYEAYTEKPIDHPDGTSLKLDTAIVKRLKQMVTLSIQ
jgi:hypothetical protein